MPWPRGRASNTHPPPPSLPRTWTPKRPKPPLRVCFPAPASARVNERRGYVQGGGMSKKVVLNQAWTSSVVWSTFWKVGIRTLAAFWLLPALHHLSRWAGNDPRRGIEVFYSHQQTTYHVLHMNKFTFITLLINFLFYYNSIILIILQWIFNQTPKRPHDTNLFRMRPPHLKLCEVRWIYKEICEDVRS